MHILHALFTPSLGGIESAYVKISKVLTNNGHRVTALMRHDAPYADDVAEVVSDVCFATPRGFYDIRAIWRIRSQLKKLRPDVIIAHAPRAISLMKYAAMGLGIPVCGILHSYRLSRVRHADRLVVLSEHMRQFVMEGGYPAGRLSIVPNMIALPEVMPVFHAPRTPFCIGAIGRLVPEKGFDVLVDAVALLHGKGLAVRLSLAGAGPQEAMLRQKVQALGIEAQVVFEGWLQNKVGFFVNQDVFCLPSLEESFGIVLLEAMMHGVPIVATDTFGPLAVITSGKDGLVVPKGNAQALADAIESVMMSKELAQHLALGGWQRVQDFSMPHVLALWEDVLLKTVALKANQKN